MGSKLKYFMNKHNELIESRKKTMKLEKEERKLSLEMKTARRQMMSFERHCSPQKLAKIISDPSLHVAELNLLTARCIGIEQEYKEAVGFSEGEEESTDN